MTCDVPGLSLMFGRVPDGPDLRLFVRVGWDTRTPTSPDRPPTASEQPLRTLVALAVVSGLDRCQPHGVE